MKVVCAHCRKPVEKRPSDVNRAQREGMKLFCNQRCFGLDRRVNKTKAQKVAEKKAYDAGYRKKNLPMLKAKKRDYHLRTYDSVKAAVYRKKRMPRHVEYCRQPAYKVWKREYDRKYRASEFGEFAEAYMLTIDLNREIKGRMTNEQIKWQNGCANKSQLREREARQPQRGAKRPRDRRDRNQPVVG